MNTSTSAELTAKQIRDGWEATFSTNNPYCPCDLKSFTKAVNWAQRALASSPQQVVDPVGAAPRITLDFKMASELLDMFGGEPGTVTLIPGDGHSGAGLYAYYEEVPEEGAEFLGVPDDDAMPATQATNQAEPVAAVASDELIGAAITDMFAARDLLPLTKGSVSSYWLTPDEIRELFDRLATRASIKAEPVPTYSYVSTQATKCAKCGRHKHTPLRMDAMGGYVCLTCIDQKLGSLLGEFGYADPSLPEDVEAVIACLGDDAASLREVNAEDERADNMDRAAELLLTLSARDAQTIPSVPADATITVPDETYGVRTWTSGQRLVGLDKHNELTIAVWRLLAKEFGADAANPVISGKCVDAVLENLPKAGEPNADQG